MKKLFKNLSFIAVATVMSAVSLLSFAGCGSNEGEDTEGDTDSTEQVLSLDFSKQVTSWEKKTNAKFSTSYYTAHAVYCTNPVYAGQSMDIYVPVDYLNSDGSLNKTAKVGGYTSETAPIIYWNSHGSYIGMGPFTITGNSTRSTQYGWVLNMIKEGFVVVMVGERGKTTTDDSGNVVGRGPIAIADLKAGVRFLKHNDDVIPGSSDRIVSVGTSSGGAMSALLGASGNNSYFDQYLEDMGACMDETDDVYATQAYCPITDLSHADYAYEWMFNEDNEDLTDFQKALSQKLTVEYATYINGFNLTDEDGNALTLASDGSKSGSYYDWLVKKYESAFEDYAENFESDYKSYVTDKEYATEGASDADKLDWITYDSTTNKATLVTPAGYDSALDALVLSGYRARQKICPAFDNLDLSGDTEVFGEQGPESGKDGSARHYSQTIAQYIYDLKDEFPDEYNEYYQTYYDGSHTQEVMDWSKYINAYSYVTGEAEGTISPYFRINMGTQDADTSCTVSATLALLLQKKGIDAEFNLMWGWGHNDVDTPHGLADWVKSICK
jgi:acetyl esterase/lipase